MSNVVYEIELDALAGIFIKHDVLNRKGITFNQFITLCKQGKMDEAIS